MPRPRITPLLTAMRAQAMLATPAERSNALGLLLLCGEQQNGGRIRAAAGWTPKQWLLTAGVIGKPQNCTLYHWEDADLVVDLYAAAAARHTAAVSAARRKAAAARWNTARAASTPPPAAAPRPAAATDAALTPSLAATAASPQYKAWLAAVLAAIPPLRGLHDLPADCTALAAAAYQTRPDAAAPETAAALTAYFTAKKADLVCAGVRDYRPAGTAPIFRALHDIITYATEYIRRSAPKKTKPRKAPAPEPTATATEEEIDAMFAELRAPRRPATPEPSPAQ